MAHKTSYWALGCNSFSKVLLSMRACPLLFEGLRGRVSAMPSVSDAPLTDGAIWIGHVLTKEGRELEKLLTQRADDSLFEKFKDVWLKDSGLLCDGAAQCAAISLASWPSWLGLVLPARDECGSWWKHNEGFWSAGAADDPCLKALEGYKLPSCFGCEATGNVDHLVCGNAKSSEDSVYRSWRRLLS
jgi:hypothetical protein